jgi:multidrug efflux pump subunit AcrA (membrane-fusion protein)
MGDVYEMDRPHVNEGDLVTVTVKAYPARTFQGVVDWVSDVIDPVLRTSKVRCVIENPEHLLKPEMYEALTISMPGKQMVAIPRSALMRVGSDTVVFIATGQQTPTGAIVFRRRKVTANEQVDGDVVPVLSGLEAGERIAVRNSVLLLGMLQPS